ncbi:hypothetical protein ACVWYK_001334 [Bradyrhizobium sp. USDA 4470]
MRCLPCRTLQGRNFLVIQIDIRYATRKFRRTRMWSVRRLFIWSQPRKLRLRSFSVPRRDQMNVHKNAPLTPKGREAMMRSVVWNGLSQAGAADLFNRMPKTVAKWTKRFRAEGVDGLLDRTSRLHSSPANPRSHVHRHRGLAPAAPNGQADCSRGRDLAGYRQPRPTPPGVEPDTHLEVARAGAPL